MGPNHSRTGLILKRHPGLAAILTNIGWLTVDKIIRMGVSLLVGIWLARYLGPEQYGQIHYAIAITGLFGAAASLGLHGIVVREIAKKHEDAGQILGTAFVMHLIGGLIAWVLLAGAATMLQESKPMITIIVLLGGCIVLKSSDVVKYWFEAKVQSRHAIWIETTIFIGISVVKIALILIQATLMAFVWAIIVEAALVAAGLFWVYGKSGETWAAWRIQAQRAGTLLRESWPLILANVAVIGYMRIDQIMIGSMLGSTEVGIYATAVRVIESFYFLPAAIAASIVPSLIAARERSNNEYLTKLDRVLSVSFVASVMIFVPLAAFSENVIQLLFGKQYENAGEILLIYAFALPFVFLGAPAGKWFLIEGMQRQALYRVASGLGLNVCMNFFLIPLYGAKGAALSTVAALAMANFLANAINPNTRPIFVMQCRALMPWRILVSGHPR